MMYPIPMSEAFLISDLLPKLWLQIQIPPGLECRKFPLWFMGKLLLIFILLDKMICSGGSTKVFWVMCTVSWGMRDAQLWFGTHVLIVCYLGNLF